MPCQHPSRPAFTLVEILIAIALTGFLLTGVTMVTVDMLELWATQTEDPLFDRHVDGLRRAMEECVSETNDSASTSGGGTTGGATNAAVGAGNNAGGIARPPSAVFPEAPASAGAGRAPYLRITGEPHFLLSDSRPLGHVHGWLVVEDGAGLVLYWQTDDERAASADATHRLVLSPWVTQARYLARAQTDGEWQAIDPGEAASAPAETAIWMELTLDRHGRKRTMLLPLSDAVPHNLLY
jgi:prepilin-type N-terminal cleavage/methylation domain-containing protein